jgi:hypothetical protein
MTDAVQPPATQEPAAATPPPAVQTRTCPRCGAALAPDQEWCLGCGNAVATRVAPTPRWKLPVALVAGILALLAGALVLSLVELSRDPQPVANKEQTAAATPTPSAAPDDGAAAAPTTEPGATATPANGDGVTTVPADPNANAVPGAPEDEGDAQPIPTPGNTPPGNSGADPGSSGGLASWPEGETAWTVVIASTTSRADAEKKARAAGADAGVLKSDDFSSLREGYWVVFSGQYDSRSAAQSAAEGQGGDAYARRVVPR